jgi:hypothetical protein
VSKPHTLSPLDLIAIAEYYGVVIPTDGPRAEAELKAFERRLEIVNLAPKCPWPKPEVVH